MASNHTQSPNGRQTVQRTSGENARWTAGFVALFFGLFAVVAVLSSFFCWDADQSCLQRPAEEREMLGIGCENLCGRAGALLGRLLVDDSFGVCGILIPVIVLLLGVRTIRQRPLRLNHSVLSLVLVMILGSLTLGFFLRDNLSLFASTGWGGAFGIEAAAFLSMHIGAVGTLILLAGGWILTGVFINRSFINTVNEAGNVMVDRSEKIVDSVLHKVVHARAGEDESLEEPASAPAPAPAPVAAPQPAPAPAEPAAEEEYPFLDETPETDAESDRTPQPEAFPEERLAAATAARVVMGPGGLVELEHPEDAAPEAAPEVVRRSFSDGPFEEFVIGREEPEPAEPHAEAPEDPAGEPAAGCDPAEVSEAAGEQTDAGGVVVTVEAKHDRLADERSITTESYDPLKDLVNYRKPPVTLLEDYMSDSEVSDEEIYENKSKIEETLKYFGIPIQRIKATVGPTVTLYEIVQAQGVKISKIQGLENDIAQSLKALGIRIIAPIPGKGTIGIEVPNRDKQVVSMYSSVRSMRFQESKAELPVVIGRTIQNENYVFDLAKMPHLLVAGATGQGKSVGLNAIITSLLYRKHPAQLKFVMIDPKMVEFSLYAKLEGHFLAKMESEDKAIITDPMKAVYTLNSLCTEMDNRLELCSEAGARNIVEYNAKFTSRRLNPEKGHRYLPYIVVVVDEFADLIMMAREVERPVMRLAQKARAVGIHLIIATQRPDVKVITGGIKANFPARIAFRVMQMIDSRTIIDQPGANQLIGRGDMLFSKDGELTRIQCALVETAEVERIVEHISKQQGYTGAYALPDYTPEGDGGAVMGSEESSAPVKYDSLFAEIARDAVSNGQISTSMIQRNYEVGFNRAGRIMMQLERAGIVGRQQGAKPRDILFHDSPSLEAKLQDLGLF